MECIVSLFSRYTLTRAAFFSLFFVAASATSPTNVSAEYIWTKFNATSSVTDYALDDTSLWAAASHGLIRYNLSDMSSELIQRPEWGTTHTITAVDISGDGTIGVASSNGVSLYDGQHWKTYTKNDGIASNDIIALHGKPNGDFWFVTRNQTYPDRYQHIYRYRNGIVERMDPWSVLNEYYGAYSLVELPETNDVWCAIKYPQAYESEFAILRYRNGEWSLYSLGDGQLPVGITYADNNVTYITTVHNWKTYVSVSIFRVDDTGFSHYAFHECYMFSEPSIAIDNDGTVWVAEIDGLFRFDGENWSHIPREEYGSGRITRIAFDPDGNLYLVSRPELGLYDEGSFARYDGSEWYVFDENDNIPAEITDIAGRDKNNRMWFKTPAGYVTYDGATWTLFDNVPVLSAIKSSTGIWGIFNRGVIAIDDEVRQFNLSGLLPSLHVSSLAVSPNGTVFAGTGTGLAAYENGDWQSFLGDNTLQMAGITDIAFDSQGYAWASSSNNGLFRQTSDGWMHLEGSPVADFITIGPGDSIMVMNRFHTYTYDLNTMLYTDHGDPPGITAFTFDPDGRLWVGGNYDLFTWSEAGWDTVTIADGYGGSNVTAMHIDSDGIMWIASGNMIYRYDGERWTSQILPGKFSVSNIYHASNGMLWASDTYDLYVFDGISWHLVIDGAGHTSDTISGIIETPDHRIWVSMKGGGIWRLDQSEYLSREATDEQSFKWTAFNRSASEIDPGWFTFRQDGALLVYGGYAGTMISDGTVTLLPELKSYHKNSVRHGSNGDIWFGTSFSGLKHYDSDFNIIDNYKKVNGLPSDEVYSFTITPDNTIWVATNLWSPVTYDRISYISRFDGTSWHTYTEADGIPESYTYIYSTTDNRVYLKSLANYLYTLQDDSWARLSIDGEPFSHVYPDDGTGLWLGTDTGLYHYDNGSTVRYTTEDGLPANNLQITDIDGNGILWGTYGDGVAGYNGTRWITYLTPEPPQMAAVAPDGSLWAGTKDYLLMLSDDYRERFDAIPIVEEEDAGNDVPKAFTIRTNYPNPFNNSTTIVFDIPRDDRITIDIFNILGQKVRTLADRHITAGTLSLRWDGCDDTGISVASGIYIVQMRGTHAMAYHRMLLLQ